MPAFLGIENERQWLSIYRPLADLFRNAYFPNPDCRRKAKMSALSKVGMSVFSLLVVRFGGCGSDGCGADEQARAESD
jgi:hypothetical protein